MIKTQELKQQMDDLSKQNDMLLVEFEQLKKMIMNGGSQNSDDSSGSSGGGQYESGQSTDNGQQQSQDQNQNQNQNQDQSGTGGSQSARRSASSGKRQQSQDGQNQQDSSSGGGNQQAQGYSQQQNGSSGNNGSSAAVSEMADDLYVIKNMVEQLERKTSQYVSEQTNQSLTEKDVVNLVLYLMNGMIDWTSEFVGKNQSSSGSSGPVQ
ncbi:MULTISPECIES: hypothetical protein [unclassified Paenibacillus]|uniref:hypothetical protein n=1 Tax=unclassified Paenibacillus TaxID=185978 RepID=UPI00020D79D8|nr:MULTISPECIES: hypothetical protein [unclassified Paenibacillus]EGL19815.1 hypothetical protein HMPREF9413_3561 [Paenibacillus sp. HGF7]EPD92230.1 hypothetical protein HMPREF1207_00896 [Paenibacillus sp. HGH0039]